MNQHAERLDWLWRRGSQDAVSSALDKIEDGRERSEVYGRAFTVAQRWRPPIARFIGDRYVDEFYREAEPFGEGVKPEASLLWDLVDLYERDRNMELACWVCEFAVAFQVGDDAMNFAARLATYRAAGELQSA
ncbi:MAG TPA: hypothetical protein VNB29_10280 [Chthoniobacterales bacterium]|nr:hypothetical protein [Chthoniobacterales bacterium]